MVWITKRSAALLLSALAAALVAWPARPDLDPSPGGTIEVKLRTITHWTPTFPGGADFELAPTDIVPLHDGTGRMMVSTLGGVIHLIDADGTMAPSPLLTTSQTGLQLQQESGMTGIALHPDFANPGTFGHGKLYTITTENGSGNGGLGNNDVDFPFNNDRHQDVIREWDLSAIVGNAGVFTLPAVELNDSREVLRVDQPGPYHNLFDLAFNTAALPGTDDYGQLYISSGDGGDNGGYNRRESAQDLSTIYGNILRINPDPAAHALVRTSFNTGLPAYSVSPLNPYNGDNQSETTNRPGSGDENDSLAEIWANGMRSPYRINFDRATGALYHGDVGENSREEVNRIQLGGNYGWGRHEGTRVENTGIALRGNTTHTPPLFEYTHSVGSTVVGGFVYRGSAIPELVGKYVFLDYGNGNNTATLFYGVVDPFDPGFGKFYELIIDPDGSVYPGPSGVRPMPDHVFSIGEDEDGELYLVAGEDPRPSSKPFPDAYVVKIVSPRIPGDTDGDGDIDDFDLLNAISNFTGSLDPGIGGKTPADGDTDGDGDVDDFDLLNMISGFTGSLSSPTTAAPVSDAPRLVGR